MFFGQFLSSIWYWCIDQEMAQRVISCKSASHAKAASIAAGFLKLLPPFMIVLPGMAARLMFEKCFLTQGLEFPSWCETRLDIPVETNKAYPYLIMKTLPSGLVGLVLASMILAMMSALSSAFNSASTVFTLDIYHRFLHPRASQARLLLIGRLFTFIMIVCSFCWLIVIQQQSSSGVKTKTKADGK